MFKIVALWLLMAAAAVAQPIPTIAVAPPSTYVGPIDAYGVAAQSWWSCTRSGRRVYGAGSACTLRRASDNTTTIISFLPSGAFNSAAANAFAGTDATATCTSATTTLTCSGASGTPHQFSTVTGAGLTQPCWAASVGTFTAGAGTVTTVGPTGAGCGTVASGVTMIFQYGLFVTRMFDVSGSLACGSTPCSSLNVTNATQPQWLPLCLKSATLPCTANTQTGTSILSAGSTLTPTNGTATFSGVAQRTGGSSTVRMIFQNGNLNQVRGNTSANSWVIVGGASGSLAGTATDAVLHSFQGVMAGASSVFNIDGTETTGTATGNTTAGAPGMFNTSTTIMFWAEAGFFDGLAATLGERTAGCLNQATYYGTTVGTAC